MWVLLASFPVTPRCGFANSTESNHEIVLFESIWCTINTVVICGVTQYFIIVYDDIKKAGGSPKTKHSGMLLK